jgi:hypothetical protein
MNIDDLKDAWNHDEPKDMHLPVSTADLGKTTSAVERIRKNMKSEFVATLISYGIILLFLYKHPQISFMFNIAVIFLFIIFIINCYYFSRFYIFYKSISRYDLSIKESIQKIVYEMELNTEIYKTYSFSVAPLAVLITLAIIYNPEKSFYIQQMINSDAHISLVNLLWIFLVIIISFMVTYLGINFHVRTQYGKYLSELKKIMEDLRSVA